MDASRALMQFEEATQFHKKNEAVKLYDLINVTDFEDTRKLVGWAFLQSLFDGD